LRRYAKTPLNELQYFESLINRPLPLVAKLADRLQNVQTIAWLDDKIPVYYEQSRIFVNVMQAAIAKHPELRSIIDHFTMRISVWLDQAESILDAAQRNPALLQQWKHAGSQQTSAAAPAAASRDRPQAMLGQGAVVPRP
jgi:hypothetical protein